LRTGKAQQADADRRSFFARQIQTFGEKMKRLTNEILQRFPEVAPSVFKGDEDLPYVMMGHLSHWVLSQVKTGPAPGLISRIKEFSKWCETQPRGENASDDIWTIYVVGFHEEMFEDEKTRSIIPTLATRQELLDNRDYLIAWVGWQAYEDALKKFK